MRAFAASLLILVAALHTTQVRASAREGAVCVAIAGQVDGLSADEVRAALLVEGRKQDRRPELSFTDALADCPPATSSSPGLRVLLGPEASAAVLRPLGSPTALDLSGLDPLERAGEVARAVMAALPASRGGGPEPLLDLSRPVWIPEAPAPIAGTETPLGGFVTVGGGYVFDLGPDTHWGELEAEVALALFDGRLSVGVAGVWGPEHTGSAGRFDVNSERGDLLGVVRAGLWTGPVLVRVGLGGGWQWRRLSARVPERFDPIRADSGAGVVMLEADALYPVWEHVVVGLAVPLKLYLGGVNHVWNGERFHEAARAAFGARLKVGVSF